jgi:hypothetical protein
MQRYLTGIYWMMGSMDFWINGSMVSIIDRHAGLEAGAFARSCLLAFLMVIPACAKICKKPKKFAKIQVNQASKPQ